MITDIIMGKIKSALYPRLQKARYSKLISAFENAKSSPLAENRITMLSSAKGELGGNLKAIKDYVEGNSLDFEIRAYTADSMPSAEALAAELATSEYILVDDYQPLVYPLVLRRNQHLVQVWHAMGAFKKFGYARETAEKNSLTHKNYTEAIVSSPELTKLYADSFGISESRVIPVGTPRTDYFFDGEYRQSAVASVYEREPRLKDKKIALFAPTFRGESVKNGYYPADYLDLNSLAEELGEDWALIIKLHPYIKNKIEIPEELSGRVFDFSDVREINNLLFVTDVLITDYSSVIFENAVIGGACVHYVPDLEEYTQGRGFYFDYSEYVCGEVVKDKAELAKAVLGAKSDDERMTQFKKRFVSLCDGNSSKRFVEMILED